MNCELEIQICTFGQQGVDRVASNNYPSLPGVKWLISVQTDPCEPGKTVVPDTLADREDIEVIIHNDKGLSRNRNHALDFNSDTPYVLIGDDDVVYYKDGITRLIQTFKNHPEVDIVCLQYLSQGKPAKLYSEKPFNLRRPPRGWYVSSIEIAFKRKIAERVRFNEHLGIGSDCLIAGEETVWLHDALKAGYNGLAVPVVIGEHNNESTSERLKVSQDYLLAYGAVLTHIKPASWILRLVVHAFRTPTPFFRCLKFTFRGAIFAFRNKIFS